MPVGDAIALDNFIPDTGGLKLREGFAKHATDMTGSVDTLMTYSPPNGDDVLFAAVATGVYDVTAEGSATGSLSVTNGRLQWIQFATTGGNYLWVANGVDDIYSFDGSSWSAPSISGVTSSNIANLAVHMNRIWMCENNSLDAWYMPTAAITGTASKLRLGSLAKLGGYLLAIASWTRDGGAGMDDLAVFITSKGEAIIYSGTDPASSTTWQLVGVFRIPEPVGRRCVIKTGADVGIITSQGVLPLSAILPLAQTGMAKVAATDKISGAVATAYNGSSTEFGWQLIEYPKGGLLIMNVPIDEGVTAHQYVMNTKTAQWCRFTGINAASWALLGDELYFGGFNGKVYKYGGLYTDDGENINAVAFSSFSPLGVRNNKMVRSVRPRFTGPDGYAPLIALRADYDTSPAVYSASPEVSVGAYWDEAEWDIAEWALSLVSSGRWQSAFTQGMVISVTIAVAVSDRFEYIASDLMFETGGYL